MDFKWRHYGLSTPLRMAKTDEFVTVSRVPSLLYVPRDPSPEHSPRYELPNLHSGIHVGLVVTRCGYRDELRATADEAITVWICGNGWQSRRYEPRRNILASV
jgi:hypothetical protein